MIEAELKARLVDPASVRAALSQRAESENAAYRDVYFDHDDQLDSTGRELRLRTVETAGAVRHLLTFKEPAVEAASGSKPEYETSVATPSTIVHMLGALGYRPSIELTKLCENYRFDVGGRLFTATIVEVPELADTFLEVETMAEEDDVAEALASVREALADLGVGEAELTTELYTDAVRAART